MDILRAEGLWIEKNFAGGILPFLHGIDLGIEEGRVTVLMGETGSGKTLLGRSLAGLLPNGFRQSRGRILFRGRVLDTSASWAGVRGREIFYAPQNAAACLNPVLTIGRQLRESSLILGRELEDLLARLQFADPRRVLASYPFALSGGENQRCLLAMALASGAGMLVLDEPTSELDAAAQDEFARVLLEHVPGRSLAVLLITHHLGFVKEVAGRLCVLSRGELVAAGDPQAVLSSPEHPYVREIADYLSSG